MVEDFDQTLLEIAETPFAGRGVFALKDITKATRLGKSDNLVASSIFYEYRKEVCAHCFAYDLGRTWKEKDPRAGLFFCSPSCQHIWQSKSDAVVQDAYSVVSDLIRKKKSNDRKVPFGFAQSRLTLEEVNKEWANSKDIQSSILSFRYSQNPTKQQIQNYRKTLSHGIEPDVILYMLSAICHFYLNPNQWANLLDLKTADSPYAHLEDLKNHITSYNQLLAILPEAILQNATVENVRRVSEASDHNTFDLRSLDDAEDVGSRGTEHFGTGLWPSASYWNHSCNPNVGKIREGRSWKFWALRDIQQGEQMCITYLGGHEREWPHRDRQIKLKETWGFDCACSKCEEESGDSF